MIACLVIYAVGLVIGLGMAWYQASWLRWHNCPEYEGLPLKIVLASVVWPIWVPYRIISAKLGKVWRGM